MIYDIGKTRVALCYLPNFLMQGKVLVVLGFPDM